MLLSYDKHIVRVLAINERQLEGGGGDRPYPHGLTIATASKHSRTVTSEEVREAVKCYIPWLSMVRS